MRRFFFVSLLLSLGALQAEPSPSPAASPAASPEATPSPSPTPRPPRLSTRELINGLSDEEVSKALEALRGDFLDNTRTDDPASRRATLEGFVWRLSPGVVIVDAAHKDPPASDIKFLAEILDSHIAYIRPGSLSTADLSQFDATLAGFDREKVDSIILDLRAVAPSGNFEVAADFARRLCPKGKLLFSLQKPSAKQERIFTSNQDPSFEGVLIVLTDSDSSGAAEALAATLRLNANAMIIGTDTTGEAVEFSEAPLGKNALLRVAIAQVILPEHGPIFPGGIKPDVAISLPREVQNHIFETSSKEGVSQFVYETPRQHMNEASLVANKNPEIDAAQAAQKNKGKSPQYADTVLQRAVDLITAINFYRDRE